MTRRARAGYTLAIYVLVLVALMVQRMLARGGGGPDFEPSRAVVACETFLKLAASGAATVYAAKCAIRLEAGNPARLGFWLMTASFAAFFVGDAMLDTYPVILGRAIPQPSAGDLAFLVAYAMIAASMSVFISAYRGSGMAVGSDRELAAVAVIALVCFGAMVAPLIAPIASSGKTLGERAVAVGYPIIDLIALVPTMVLLRIAFKFRGGQVGATWTAMLFGIVFIAAGDVAFAYLIATHRQMLAEAADAMYAAGYAAMAYGAEQHWELVD